MYKIMEIGDNYVTYYTISEEPKLYATEDDAIEEIKGLHDMEYKLFGECMIEFKVVEV